MAANQNLPLLCPKVDYSHTPSKAEEERKCTSSSWLIHSRLL